MKFKTYAHIYLASIGIPLEDIPPSMRVFGKVQHRFWGRVSYQEALTLFHTTRIVKPVPRYGYEGMLEELIYESSHAFIPSYFAKESIWRLVLAQRGLSRHALPATAAPPASAKTFRKLNFFQKTACVFLRLVYSRASGKQKIES